MAKINFTQEHYTRMCELLMNMLIENEIITTKFGGTLNAVELLHTTTIGTLNSIRLALGKKIEQFEAQDEWVSPSDFQEELENLKTQKELVNLIVGYKRLLLEQEENALKKKKLTEQIHNLEEAQKTPEDKIAELKAELKELD